MKKVVKMVVPSLVGVLLVSQAFAQKAEVREAGKGGMDAKTVAERIEDKIKGIESGKSVLSMTNAKTADGVAVALLKDNQYQTGVDKEALIKVHSLRYTITEGGAAKEVSGEMLLKKAIALKEAVASAKKAQGKISSEGMSRIAEVEKGTALATELIAMLAVESSGSRPGADAARIKESNEIAHKLAAEMIETLSSKDATLEEIQSYNKLAENMVTIRSSNPRMSADQIFEKGLVATYPDKAKQEEVRQKIKKC